MADEQVTMGAGAPQVGAGAEESREDFDSLPDDILASLDGGNVEEEEEGAEETGSGVSGQQNADGTPATGVTTTTTAQPQSTTVTTTTTVASANETPEAKAAREEAARVAAAAAAQPIVETPEQKTAREAAEKVTHDEWMGTLDLLVNPEKALPKLAAKMHAQVFKDATQAALRLVTAAMPGLIKMHSEGGAREDKAKTEFYSRYPFLNKPEFAEKVLSAGRMYRQLKPDATPDEVMENMALFGAKALGVEFVPWTPSATAQPGKPAKQPRPANAGGGSQQAGTSTPKKGGSEWADLAADDDD